MDFNGDFMDLLDSIKYTIGRFFLVIALTVFGCFFGMIVLPGFATLIPGSAEKIKNFVLSPVTGSVSAMIIMILLLSVIFYLDGKKHTAYENYSGVTIGVIQIILWIMYLIPGMFRDSFAAEGRAELFYKIWYYPCSWLYNGLNADFSVSIIVIAAVMGTICTALYIISYYIYLSRHPSLKTR